MQEREKETDERAMRVGEMRKRREKMADGRRYIIYYTFASSSDEQTPHENDSQTEKENE